MRAVVVPVAATVAAVLLAMLFLWQIGRATCSERV